MVGRTVRPSILRQGKTTLAIGVTGRLRVLICEDEYLVAMEMAAEAKAHGATDVTIMSGPGELNRALENADFSAELAILAVSPIEGHLCELVALLENRNIAIVFCSGYTASESPADLAHIPWLPKPFRAEEFGLAMAQALNQRSVRQSD